MARSDFGISLEDAVNELGVLVEDASQFMFSEYLTDWETGEAYYAGKCDLPTEQGRSTVVKTETRDAIRALMPSIMRVLLQSKKPIEYIPASIRTSRFATQQSLWVNQHFMISGGYTALYDAVLESMKLKAGPIKVFWEEDPHPEHISATQMTAEELLLLEEDPDVVVDEINPVQSPDGGVVYDVEATRYYENGRIVLEAFPIYEFFTERNASNLRSLHGHRRSVKVADAIAMGLDYENWRELGDDNPRNNDAAAVERQRRGYVPNQDEIGEQDVMNHEFLLTEAYCEYDLDGDGVPEKYVFYLGGTNYKYLHHEEIEDFCIEVVNIDPQPFTVIGRSIVDITKQSTDNETSVLRAIVDNAHIANNPRPAADPSRVNFNDLMNNAIGAPIRTKGTPDIKYVDVPFTGGGLLPLLEWMEKDAEMRVGVTKAARGLDPDALQSTDKDAVMNTINLSQGQVELIVRHICEKALIPLFRKYLQLSVRHMPRRQMMKYKGAVVPVDLGHFDPDLAAVPNVGIGCASPQQRLATLQFVMETQATYMEKYGLDNPFVSLAQMYNTLEDMIELGGISDPGRYFNYIGPDMERAIAQGLMQKQMEIMKQQEDKMPLDPGRAVVMQEQLRAQMKKFETMAQSNIEMAKLQQRSLEAAESNDLKRDDLAQTRIIELAKIRQDGLNDKIKQEQANNDSASATGTETSSGA